MKKKRLISKLLSLVTVLAMLAAMSGTATAIVPSYPLWVGGTQVNASNAANITGEETATASYNASTNTLTLNGVNIQTGFNSVGIWYQGPEVLTINLAPGSTNKIGVDAFLSRAIQYNPIQEIQLSSVTEDSSTGLVITGSGSLEAKASFGIVNSGNNITISGGEVSVEAAPIGISADNGTVEITDGKVEVKGGAEGIHGSKGVKITGGTVKATGGSFYGITSEEGKCVIGSKVTSVTASGDDRAIKGKVENAIAGTGWTDMEGTEGMADIAVSEEQELNSYKKVQFPPAKVDVTSVKLNKDDVTLTVGGDSVTLEATVAPDDAADKTVIWSSDKTSVATVTDAGVVAPVSAGSATITVTATNGTDDTSDDKTATCVVTVNMAAPTANAPTGLTATVGQTLADVKLTNPEGNTEGTWEWADSSTKLEKAGEQSFKANFTPKDKDTYYSVVNVDVKVTVKEQEKEPEKEPEKQPEQEPEKEPETVPAPVKEEKITCTTNFRGLKLRVAKRDKSSIKVKWTEKKDADGYKVYGGLCTGKDDEMELLKTIKNNKTTSWTHKKLKSGTSYKYKVVAYKKVKGEKKSLYKSMAVHVYTKGGKYTVAKGVKVNKSEVKLKKGKTFQIEASEVKDEKKKDLNTHRDICYESSNEKVATVSEKGKIKAVKKGSATVYAYSETGAFSKIKVIVK